MLIHKVKFEIYFKLRSRICSAIIDGEITVSPHGLDMTVVFLCWNVPVDPDLDHSLTVTSIPGPPDIRPGFSLSLLLVELASLLCKSRKNKKTEKPSSWLCAGGIRDEGREHGGDSRAQY